MYISLTIYFLLYIFYLKGNELMTKSSSFVQLTAALTYLDFRFIKKKCIPQQNEVCFDFIFKLNQKKKNNTRSAAL
jgi:hypothetical protein